MYKRVRLKDTVEVPPRYLADVTPERVKHLLQEKLEGRMDEDVGSIVTVTRVHNIEDGAVPPGRRGSEGSVFFPVEFDAVTFDPEMQEVVDGEVVEVVNFGAFVGIGPVDGLLHVSQISDEYLTYDEENQTLAARENNRTLTTGDSVRARIVTKSVDERNPRDSKIGLTAKQVGLGKHGWLQEDREEDEQAVEGE